MRIYAARALHPLLTICMLGDAAHCQLPAHQYAFCAVQVQVAAQTHSITFPKEVVAMDMTFTRTKLGVVRNPEATPTQRALARKEQQPELRSLGVCLPAYLAPRTEKGTMLCDVPSPASRRVRPLPRLLCNLVVWSASRCRYCSGCQRAIAMLPRRCASFAAVHVIAPNQCGKPPSSTSGCYIAVRNVASAYFMLADYGGSRPLQFQVADSAAVPLVLHRGGVIWSHGRARHPAAFIQVAMNPASPLLPPGMLFSAARKLRPGCGSCVPLWLRWAALSNSAKYAPTPGWKPGCLVVSICCILG